jgi:four helix bundle protein
MHSTSGQRFRDLHAWRMSVALAKEIYLVTARFPTGERFGLVSQMRRAAVSVPSNIAEGSARRSRRQFAHFLEISLGSLAELETQLEIAHGLQLLQDSAELEDSVMHVRRLLYGLHSAMSRH